MKTKWDIHFNQCMNGAKIAENEGHIVTAARLIRFAIHAAEHVSENRSQARRIAQRDLAEVMDRIENHGEWPEAFNMTQVKQKVWAAISTDEREWLQSFTSRAHG